MGKKANPPPAYVRLTHDDTREDRVRKGKVPVLVGEGEVMERLLIPTKLFKHPYIVALLEMSANEFGYQQQGTLKIPCAVECLRRSIEMISKEKWSYAYEDWTHGMCILVFTVITESAPKWWRYFFQICNCQSFILQIKEIFTPVLAYATMDIFSLSFNNILHHCWVSFQSVGRIIYTEVRKKNIIFRKIEVRKDHQKLRPKNLWWPTPIPEQLCIDHSHGTGSLG